MRSSSNWPENSASAAAAPLPSSSSNSRQLVPPPVDPARDSDLRQRSSFSPYFHLNVVFPIRNLIVLK